MNNYTVLLLYPDFLTDSSGQETYLAHVEAANPQAADKAAKTMARRANGNLCKNNDFYTLGIFAGTLTDLQFEASPK